MADIFISYSREDEPTAIHLRDVLAGQGWDVWRDKEGILTGTSWEKSIEDALNAAKCVIVVWSRSALGSHFVRDEASVARNAGKLVPVQIDNAEIPLGFRGIQTANLVGWKGDLAHPEFRKLVRALEERVGANRGAPVPPPKPPPRPWRERLGLDKLPDAASVLRALSKPGYLVAIAAVAGLVLLLAGFGIGRLTSTSGGEPAHDALEQGLKNFFDGKYVEAETSLRTAANAGSGIASYYLARMYRDGLGVKNDDKKALEWAQRGAARGSAQAQNLTGLLLDAGRGAPRNGEAALAWYLKAADQGMSWAAFNAGNSVEAGRGGKAPDPTKAYEYYRRAADDQNAAAGNAIGNLYLNGRGVPPDLSRAIQWYKWSAERGNPDAELELGFLYANARGLERDDGKALELYRRAAEQGSAGATNNLGYMYEYGRGVPLDLNAAAAYYRRAADLGDKTAISNLGRVQEKLRTSTPTKR
jgi:TPR repeat protein